MERNAFVRLEANGTFTIDEDAAQKAAVNNDVTAKIVLAAVAHGRRETIGKLNTAEALVKQLTQQLTAELGADPAYFDLPKFKLGDLVQKKQGSSWRGKVVGFYFTAATPIGYSVESLHEPGSVQVWPEAALIPWKDTALTSLRTEVEHLILRTPTSLARNELCDINLKLMQLIDLEKKNAV